MLTRRSFLGAHHDPGRRAPAGGGWPRRGSAPRNRRPSRSATTSPATPPIATWPTFFEKKLLELSGGSLKIRQFPERRPSAREPEMAPEGAVR